MKRALTTKMILWLALATATVVLMAASSPQCARTSDRSADVSLNPLAPDPANACARDCKATARAGTKAERRRHRLASKACNGDAQCHVEEDALHAAIQAEIASDQALCIDACSHQQGAGVGGQ